MAKRKQRDAPEKAVDAVRKQFARGVKKAARSAKKGGGKDPNWEGMDDSVPIRKRDDHLG